MHGNQSTRLTRRFEEALLYAHQLHSDQLRKGRPVPYIAHLLGVASLVLEHGASEEEAIAALLHDAVEDQGGAATREEIRRRFGETVMAIVDGCSDADTLPKPPWQARKESFIASLKKASPSVRLVTAADKLHNVRSLMGDYRAQGEALWERFTGKKERTLWYYRSVASTLAAIERTPLVEELEQAIEELEQLVRKV